MTIRTILRMVKRPSKALQGAPTRRMAVAIVGKEEAPENGPAELPGDPRLPFDWTFSCGGVSWRLHFEPSPQDVHQRRVYRNGEPQMCAGLERVSRDMQKEMVPVLGRRRWRQP